jgi:hypothetical protein
VVRGSAGMVRWSPNPRTLRSAMKAQILKDARFLHQIDAFSNPTQAKSGLEWATGLVMPTRSKARATRPFN